MDMLPLAISRRLTVSHRAATLFRSSLASVVLLELYERLEINHWLYTDDGAFPRWAVMPPADVAPTLHLLCVHAWDGGHQWATGLALLQGVVALFLLCGALPQPYTPHDRWLRTAAAICWALQLSLMLRNPQVRARDRDRARARARARLAACWALQLSLMLRNPQLVFTLTLSLTLSSSSSSSTGTCTSSSSSPRACPPAAAAAPDAAPRPRARSGGKSRPGRVSDFWRRQAGLATMPARQGR